MGRLARLVRDRRGATAVEYGLIVALIVLVMLVALTGLAGRAGGLWQGVHDNVTSA